MKPQKPEIQKPKTLTKAKNKQIATWKPYCNPLKNYKRVWSHPFRDHYSNIYKYLSDGSWKERWSTLSPMRCSHSNLRQIHLQYPPCRPQIARTACPTWWPPRQMLRDLVQVRRLWDSQTDGNNRYCWWYWLNCVLLDFGAFLFLRLDSLIMYDYIWDLQHIDIMFHWSTLHWSLRRNSDLNAFAALDFHYQQFCTHNLAEV